MKKSTKYIGLGVLTLAVLAGIAVGLYFLIMYIKNKAKPSYQNTLVPKTLEFVSLSGFSGVEPSDKNVPVGTLTINKEGCDNCNNYNFTIFSDIAIFESGYPGITLPPLKNGINVIPMYYSEKTTSNPLTAPIPAKLTGFVQDITTRETVNMPDQEVTVYFTTA